ncbi:hypothetical protein PEL8287_01121 [Roseovarius litorisediminis]|uniref:Ice-binding protein C-terminal domain-containing protein n=1 Tax=Roseovarius litorisediminis TaxID=1312363 RepID=A0A1Y5RSN4_9RHOB|nr:VPLPA-CTERM sorting domain-containing protein [Roseovarius litorisediminis]SLN24519.1 hypothetical protein PEL8287_01121 [Roseovarius litorisediminis]
MKRLLTLFAVLALSATAASASHFRGGTLIPSVDANGLLTVTGESFWRKNSFGAINNITVTGPGGSVTDVRTNIVSDDAVTDSRRLSVVETFEAQLTRAGTYTISFSSCCWVGGVPNNTTTSSFGLQSVIVWDGQTATTPINFSLNNIQQEVSRLSAYSDNLGVTGPGPFTYDDTFLATGLGSNPAGYDIDSNGTITMPLSTTSAILDNTSNTGSGINEGADLAHSGQINSADGSSVQYVWVFDATNAAGNNSPDVDDVVINAVVGDNINTLITAIDPDGDPVTLSLTSFNGPGGAVGNGGFVDNGNDTGTFTWNSNGFAPGTYIAAILGSDGSLTDTGSIRINLTARTGGQVPLPATAYLMIASLGALGAMRRRKK